MCGLLRVIMTLDSLVFSFPFFSVFCVWDLGVLSNGSV
jgi:hypothetical protein